MSDLDALYDRVILEHNRRPHHYSALEGGRRGEGHNPVCGDRLTVFVRLRDGVIVDASFQGFGCAIAMAAASLMTDHVIGKTVVEAEATFDLLRGLIDPAADSIDQNAGRDAADRADQLGALAPLAGVRRFPLRVKCATLPWQALFAATRSEAGRVVSTE
jgi:nitrogen fixation NifU-like protein